MAGGTGGHVYPALAVADYLKEHDVPLFWLGTRKGLESRVVPEKGYTLFTINVGGLRGKGILKWLTAPFILALAVIQSLGVLIKTRPMVVLGMGGFASGPGGIAASVLRIPLCVHEQNAIAGLTNRLLAPFARVVMQAFPGAFAEKFGPQTIGNPVRKDIVLISKPADRYQQRTDQPMRILILGGSQGARALNRIAPEAIATLPEETRIETWHQCGERLYDETQAVYEKLAIDGKLDAFIEDMSAAYAWADLVICRAGALTVAELTAAGVASVLIPFPYAVDDHQTANARYLADEGAAILIPEEDLDATKLGHLLQELSANRRKLQSMAEKARELACPDATRRVAELCLKVAYA